MKIKSICIVALAACAPLFGHKDEVYVDINDTHKLLYEKVIHWNAEKNLSAHIENISKLDQGFRTNPNMRPFCGLGKQIFIDGAKSNAKDHPIFIFNTLNNIERINQALPWYSFLNKYRLYRAYQTYMRSVHDIKNYAVRCEDLFIEKLPSDINNDEIWEIYCECIIEDLKKRNHDDPNFKVIKIYHNNENNGVLAEVQETDIHRHGIFTKLAKSVDAQSSIYKNACLIKALFYSSITGILGKSKDTILPYFSKWAYYPLIGFAGYRALSSWLGVLTTKVNPEINVQPDLKA